jgi:putative ABC transport system permease protein
MRGAQNSLQLAADRLGADIVVVPAGSESDLENALLMGLPTSSWMPVENVDKIANIPGVEAISPQLYMATLTDASCCAVSDMFMVAFDPLTDFTVQPWLAHKLDGDLRRGEVLGGSYIFATEGDRSIRLYDYPLTLKGNLTPTGTSLDQSVFLGFDTAYDISSKSVSQSGGSLDIPADSISAILIKVTPGIDLYEMSASIIRVVPHVTPIPSASMFQSYRGQISGLLNTVIVVVAVTWVLSVFVIGLIFSMAANSRRVELGVIRALGATKRFVLRSFLMEASLIAFMGGLLGIILAGSGIFIFRSQIIDSLGIPFQLPTPAVLLFQIGGGLLLTLLSVNLATLFPAVKFSRQEPAITMRD